MLFEEFNISGREPFEESISCDFVVVGGGMAGICAAIEAARAGLSVTLVQDRPVLGGNASSEVRLWILGATSHMGNNNRWAREGGVIGEILVENLFRNKDGNPVYFDALLLDKVLAEKNIRLLLNTVVYKVEKKDGHQISRVIAFNPQNDTRYILSAPLYCDASGDGVVAYQAGVPYRMGAEDASEYSEKYSPSETFGELLGHSIMFYTKRHDHEVKYVAPSFALKDIKLIPKYETIHPDMWGCSYWWFEYGGELDTVHDTEEIKMELLKVIYCAWDYIKNSGRFPEASNLSLEWVGNIPGKRESRRFLGQYTLNQNDLIGQTHFNDSVAYGGWAVDLHPAKGVYSSLPSCRQYHSKGIYEIPLRCYIPQGVDNLFLAGRIISVTHVAFGSTRVIATCALGGQAVGEAAAVCHDYGCSPTDLLEPDKLAILQRRLQINGQSIPFIPIKDDEDISTVAKVEASSSLSLSEMAFDGTWKSLDSGAAQMLPLRKGVDYKFSVKLRSEKESKVNVSLWVSSKAFNYTPDVCLSSKTIALKGGVQDVEIGFDKCLERDQYGFVIFTADASVEIGMSSFRCSGVLSVFNSGNLEVGNHGRQIPPEGSGFEEFDFWCPDRRPDGKNLALGITPAIQDFSVGNLSNGFLRPGITTNVWAARLEDKVATVRYEWDQVVEIKEITLYFDTDFDHAMESVQWGHPEDVVPFCVRHFKILNEDGETLAERTENHETIARVTFPAPLKTSSVIIELERCLDTVPISLFEVSIR
jgi:hypothetical protein